MMANPLHTLAIFAAFVGVAWVCIGVYLGLWALKLRYERRRARINEQTGVER